MTPFEAVNHCFQRADVVDRLSERRSSLSGSYRELGCRPPAAARAEHATSTCVCLVQHNAARGPHRRHPLPRGRRLDELPALDSLMTVR
jgi:hypothetical protein